MKREFLTGLLLVLVGGSPALPCTLCGGNPQTTSTLRQELGLAKLVLYGTLANGRLNAGTTDLQIETIIKSDPFVKDKKTVELSRYVPVDPKNPPKYVVFCDILNGKLDPLRGIPARSPALVDYLRGAAALDANDRVKSLEYFFRYLDNADQDVANDAFLEFAKANDREVAQVAPRLSADKLRKMIQDPQTAANRMGLFAFMLGACGHDNEAAFLRGLLDRPSEQTRAATDGILAGYIHLRPREGWDLALAILRDNRRSFTERFAVIRAMRFFHGGKPEESKRELMRCQAGALEQGDLADMVIEDLRSWQWWDMTREVLSQYGKKSHDAPIMRRAIVRYALSCPGPEAAAFVTERRKQEPDLVKDVEELLQFEKK